MKILHIGGPYASIAPLAQAQLELGHDVTTLATGPETTPFVVPNVSTELAERLPDILSGGFDVIHLHGLHTLADGPTLPASTEHTLRALNGSAAHLVLEIADDHPLLHLTDSAGRSAVRELLSTYIRCALVGIGEAEELLPEGIAAAWCPRAYTLTPPSGPAAATPQHGLLRTLLLDPDSASAAMCKALAESPTLKERISFEIVRTATIPSEAALSALLQRVDVLIASLSTGRLDLPVLHALAHGRAVIAHNPTTPKRLQPTLPLVDAAARTLGRKLENILREPRCLHDYAKRSREYVSRYHSPQMIYAKVLQSYKKP